MKKKKMYGWVIEMKKGNTDYPGFYQDYGHPYSGPLCTAWVYRSRQTARWMVDPDEVVRKVSLYKNGKPKKIIGRG